MKLYHKIAWLPAVLPALFAFTLTGSSAQAQRMYRHQEVREVVPASVEIAHQAMRDKILHEAHDRFEVRFLTTEITPLGAGEREVIGRGVFRRHGKNSQEFTYHIIVKPREGIAFHAGYDIR